MKKKYLKCVITTKEGRVFDNDLKLSEAKLIPQIVRENKSVLISMAECSIEYYKINFG